MFVRLILAIVLAATVTLGLIYGMQALIKSGDGVSSEPPKGNVLDFIRLKQEEQVETKKRKPKKPPKPQEPPPPMEQPQLSPDAGDDGGAGLDFSADIAADVGLGNGLALESGDGEYLPIVKVAPTYPRRALQRGIEGYVIVEFTVNKAGQVTNPVVVEAKPEKIFDRAAIDAALKFKYKPRVVNGEPMAVAGVQNRIVFEMN